MIRPFAGTTLLDISLEKLRKSKIDNKNIWCSVYDNKLKNLCREYPFNIHNRSKRSAQSEGKPITEIFDWWDKIPAKYVIMVNACCPFVSIDTIEKFFYDYKESSCTGMFGVVESRDYFWNQDGVLIAPVENEVMNTKFSQPVLKAAHCLYAGSLDDIGKNIWMGNMAKQNDIKLWKMNEEEVFDIDYEWEFNLYEELYKQRVLKNEK
tara:strand:+ start:433 stop:1056 length:624 start_codon:yes stop_codon:yes gene_type:complete